MRCAVRAIATLLTAPLLAPAAPGQTCPVAVLEAELSSAQPVKEAGDGTRLAFWGSTLASSAPLDHVGSVDDAGSVYVRTRVGSTWSEQERVVSTAPASGDHFGLGLALELDTLAVGAPFADRNGTDTGSVTVFVRVADDWMPQAELSDVGGQNGAGYGWSVALDGDRMVVGAPYFNHGAGAGSGAVFVYERVAGVWGLDEMLVASDSAAKDWFGYSVAIDGATVLVGAYGHGSFNQGAAYVFLRNAVGWSEQAQLVESPFLAQRLFGFAVDLEGDLAFVGAPSTGLLAPAPGSVHVYQRTGAVWNHSTELVASDGVPLDFFGGALQVRGTRLAVSARDNDQAYVYLSVGGTWLERLLVTTTELGAERFEGLSVDGDTCLLGSPFDSLPGAAAAGVTRSLRFTNGVDVSVAYCTSGISASGCQPVLSSCGTPSATAPGGFALITSGLEGDKDGIYFFSTNGQQANSWGNGSSFQCVIPPVFRGGTIDGTGTDDLCDGLAKQDLNALWCPSGCPSPGKNPGPGIPVQAQFWYRDPQSTSNQTTSLSGALEFTLVP